MPPPYYLAASAFPSPELLAASGVITAVAVIPLPDSSSGFGVAYGQSNDSNSTLWFTQASYSAVEARAIATNGSCGADCGRLPLGWTSRVNVSYFTNPVDHVRLTDAGGVLVLGASSNNSTYLFISSPPYSSWAHLANPLAGALAGLAATSEGVAIVTLTSGAADASLMTLAGAVVGQATVEPTGANSSGILSAGVALIPHGATYLESVVFTVNGSSEVEFTSSTNGTVFSAPTVIANFSAEAPNASLSPAGTTALGWMGGRAGELAMTSVAANLFVLFTTNQSGETVPATLVSGDNGTNWSGPYLTQPVNGSVIDPALIAGPTGLVYASWNEPDYGTGSVDEVSYAADGLPVAPPQTLVAASEYGNSPTTTSGIAVDGFGRPVLIWGVAPANGTNGSLAYTGGFLGASTALNLTEEEVDSTIGLADFTSRQVSQDQTPPPQALMTNVSSLVAQAEENLSERRICGAQNTTGHALYQNLTHLPLSLTSGSGTVCNNALDPSMSASPLEASAGIDAPSTFYAVYEDWALEAEGIPVSVSPLASVTDVYPYTNLALTASLPKPVSTSEKVNSETASVTVAPTPYSPTAYDLAVTSTIPATNRNTEGSVCAPPPNQERYWYYYSTVVTAWTNVSVDNLSRSFSNTGSSFVSLWIYNLTADQTYFWKGTYAARTVETEKISDACTSTNSYVNTTTVFPAMTLSGTFATTLSETYGAGLVTASLNANHTEAQVSVAFNNTLPATLVSNLSNASGLQRWNSSSFSVAESHTFPSEIAVGQTYSFAGHASSEPGNSTAPGSPSFRFSTSGTAPPETAGLHCQFTLTSTGPAVWTNNSTAGTWPYSNLTANTVQVSWFSNQDLTGFFTYRENGSSIDSTITGITPTRIGPTNWSYSVEVYGLEPLTGYGGSYGVSWTEGCLVGQAQLFGQVPNLPSDPEFSTMDSFAVSEADQTYDSITGTGGGINLTWTTPGPDRSRTLDNGSVVLQNASNASWKETIPFNLSEIVHPTVGKRTINVEDILSLDPVLEAGTKYNATLVLNYSTPHAKPQYGTAVSFVYHADSSADGLTNLEKTAGWNVSFVPSGTTVVSGNQTLTSTLVTTNLVLDAGATLTTDGFDIIVANDFFDNGTIVTGTVNYAPHGDKLANLILSHGGSGGGAYVVTPSGPLSAGNGGSTRSSGGSASNQGGHSAMAGATPGFPQPSSSLFGAWWNSSGGPVGNSSERSLDVYLSGAAGGLYGRGDGGEGGWGLYIQAYELRFAASAQIISSGSAGTPYAACSGGDYAVGGGGGAGVVLMGYGNRSLYTPLARADFHGTGGAGGQCMGQPSGGKGGNAGLVAFRYKTPPVAPPSPPALGGSAAVVRHVHANVNKFSTNGLASDYLEKEYGLDPTTVDTAGSDMLDLWNLTFDLGGLPRNASPMALVPAGIEAWDEANNSNWDPWGTGAPSSVESGIRCDASSCPGNASSVSSILWANGTLAGFLNLSGVRNATGSGGYLRGVVGFCPAGARAKCGSDVLLTLWGKLSWGADPLAGSTPADGIPDGARVDPLGGTDLQVTITGWGASNSSFQVGNSAAVLIHATSAATVDYSNYTNQSTVTSWSGNDIGSWTNFTVTFPAVPTQQFAELNLSIVQNVGTSNSPRLQTRLSAPVYSVDMVNLRGEANASVWSSGAYYSLAASWQVLPAEQKAPTWIYIPVGNATLSGGPKGLQRYTGEQNFIEFVINDTVTDGPAPTVAGIPYANNSSAGTYSFGLAPGLNNILIPRGAFLSSPFGRSVLNLSGNSTPYVPINSSNSNAFLQMQWQAEGDGAQWFNRTTGVGYNSDSPDYITVAANTTSVNSTNSSLAGGVLENPTLEAGSFSTLAIQAIYFANESSSSDLEGFLGGLLLNNSSGNFTGWLLNATGQISTLGLMPAVLAGLANATYVNDGGYPAPVSSASGGHHAWTWWDVSADWNWFWNTASGVVSAGLSILWNASLAAVAFVAGLAVAVGRFALNLASQAASLLQQVARVIVAVLTLLVDFVQGLIKQALDKVLQPIWAGCDAYGQALNGDLGRAEGDYVRDGAVPGADAEGFWRDFGGPVFGIGLALSGAVELALYIVTALCLGCGFVVGILLSLLMTSLMSSYASETSARPMESASYTQPTGRIVWNVALTANTTKVNGTLPTDRNDTNYTPTLMAAASVFGWSWSLFSLQWAWGLLMGAFIDPSGVGTAAVGLATAISALILSFVSLAIHTLFIVVTTLAVAGLSLALDFRAVLKVGGGTGTTGIMNGLTAAFDTAAFAIAIVENHDLL